MNFWILTTEYPPLSGGGISTYCYHTGQMLIENGHKVTIFIPDWNIKSSHTKLIDGVTIVTFRPDNKHHEYLGDEAAISLSFSEILEHHIKFAEEPDFIEAQEYNGIAYFALQKKLLLSTYFKNTTFYITAHAPSFLYLDYNQAPAYEIPMYWTGEMEKSVLKSADFVISPSAYLFDEVSNYISLNDQTKTVIHNPYRTNVEESSSFEPNDIVFFGKLTPQKGCIELLKYFSILWDNGFKHSLKFIGGGDHYFYPKMMDLGEFLKNKYQKYIDQNLLVFEGHINPDQLTERLQKAHIILVPSIVDNLPYTVLEAMSLGKIVLASSNGGHKEIIETGKSGYIFDHDTDGNSFSEHLKKILDLSTDEIFNIGQNAKQRVESLCGYDTVYNKKIKFLKENIRPTPKNTFPFTAEIPIKEDMSINQELTPNLLTVVVPYFNMGEYIDEAIQSILNSDYENLEIIIINDGSTDKLSLKQLNKYVQLENVRIIHQKNVGLSITRNHGANYVKGEYMAFLDADDRVEPSYYSKALSILKKYDNVSFVGCWAQYFDTSTISWPSFNPEPPYLLIHNMINSSALVYQTADFLKAGKNDEHFIYGMEDYDSVINMVKQGYRGVAIPEKLWNYRIRKGSMAQSFNNFSKSYLYRLLSKKHAQFYSNYAVDIINILNANGSGFRLENPSRVTRTAIPFVSSGIVSFVKRNKILRNIAKKIYARIVK